MHLATITYGSSSSNGGLFAGLAIVYVAVIVLVIASLWKVFTKAGKPGWAAIIPFYNWYVLLKIVGRPGWWLVWYFIPIANFVVGIIVVWELAKSFGKSAGWFWGMFLLPIIFYPMLGFGSSQYAGPYWPTRGVATGS
jgi:hypothetical protein